MRGWWRYSMAVVACFSSVLCHASKVIAASEKIPPPAVSPTKQVTVPGIVSPLPSQNFSLSTCFDQADDYNKAIIAARRNLPIARAGITAAGAIPNPQVQLQTGFGPSFLNLFTGQTQQIGFTEQIQTAGKRTKKINVARANYGLTQLQLEVLRFSIHNSVRRAYAELAAAEAYRDLIESQRDVGAHLADIASKRFEAGKAPKSEVLQAQLNVLQFDIQRNQAQGRLQQATANLSNYIGRRPEHIEIFDVDDNGLFKLKAEKTEIVPSPEVPLPNIDQLVNTAQNMRPDLKAARQQVFVNQQALLLAKAQRIPDLYLGSGYVFSTFAKHQPSQLVAESDWLGEGTYLSVTFENPLFYQHQGEVKQAVGNLRQAERTVGLLQSQVARDAVVAFNEVNVARANIFEFQDNLLPTAAQVARVARRGYQVGQTDLATAIIAQQQYQQTLSNFFDSVVAYQNAWADMEQAIGTPLRK